MASIAQTVSKDRAVFSPTTARTTFKMSSGASYEPLNLLNNVPTREFSMSNLPKAVIITLPVRGPSLAGTQGREFWIMTAFSEAQLHGPFSFYDDAERSSRGQYVLLSEADIHPDLWRLPSKEGLSASEDAEEPDAFEECEVSEVIWFDEIARIGVSRAVVWVGNQRAPAERQPRKPYVVWQINNPTVLGMSGSKTRAIGIAEAIIEKALAKAENGDLTNPHHEIKRPGL